MKHNHCFAAIISAALLLTGCQQKQTIEPEQNTGTQALTETQPTATEEGSSTQTLTESKPTENEEESITQALTEPQPTVSDTTPLSNIVSCDLIKVPDVLSSFMMSGRTAEGFGCITYNYRDRQLTYLRFSEDLQTSETFLLEPPVEQSSSISYLCFTFEADGIWAIAKEEQYLLCHYDENGSLISAIPANELRDYQIGESLDCVGDVLYMTLSDGSLLQIDKETAEVSALTDLRKDDTRYNYKLLCFDRDDKPVLLQENVSYAPDKHTIKEAVVSEFDLDSCSCGQTIYTAGDNWDRTKIVVFKGCGEYRLFINTYSELIGIRDDDSQEVLIDIDASDLDTQIMAPDDYAVPYTNDLFDINIIPLDDTQFLGFYEHYPEGRTDVYCLTRKHEAELT